MPPKNPEQWISSREIEADSVCRIRNLLWTHFPLDGIDETEHFSTEDYKGYNLILFPTREFSELTDSAVIRVQVKSSETGLDGFLEKGKKMFGKNGYEWRKQRIVALDGQWAETTLIADFVAQVANFRNLLDNPFELEGFLSQLDPYPQLCFRRATCQGLLDQYRGELYQWVNKSKVMVR